jgi:[protein-PII] uridylyltransferase
MTAFPRVHAFLGESQSEQGADEAVAGQVRSYLGALREHLRELHDQHGGGRRVNEANSDGIDQLIRELFRLAEEEVVAQGGEIESGLAVVAVGGFARREMSIHSDIDLLVLYRQEVTAYVSSIAERLQYWLWDAGLTVGCATRTIQETVSLGHEDLTVRTGVLTARFLCGDGAFFHDFSDAIRDAFAPDVDLYVAKQLENVAQRHAKFGESLFLLQPNVKEGVGGLRDYHVAYWVTRCVQPSMRDIEDMMHFGLLTQTEAAEFRSALEFLWRVRNELHFRAGRRNDQMSFEQQEQVAVAFDYTVEGEENADLPVERFMRDYYLHARVVKNLSELVIDQCAARCQKGAPTHEVREVEEGFRLSGTHLEIPHGAHLRERPVRLLEVFEIAQRHDVPLSRMATRLVRENLSLVDQAFQESPESSASFLRILDSEKRVMRTLVAMNEVGLLAAFLPEWEHIVCRWQHIVFHTYTVDVHSIFLVEELRRLWRGKYEEQMPGLSSLVLEVVDRPALFLGCLLHDIGKGFGGNHSEKGVERARVTLDRLGLDEERKERVIFLVRHHLLMSHLAQRRDLSDPKMILEFAKLCGDRRNLRALYLLTFADIRASSRDAWNEWKGQLLEEMFTRTSEFLEIGDDDPEKAVEIIERRVELRRDAATLALRDLGMADAAIDSFFFEMPRRYFMSHTPKQIVRHTQVVMDFGEEAPFSSSFREMRGNFTEFILCTRDVHGLYSRVAGTIAGCGINILGSYVYTGRSGVALEVYRLDTPEGGREERDFAWRALGEALGSVLGGEVAVSDLLARRRHSGKLRTQARTQPPVVTLSNSESDFYTIVDVVADDHVGLLHSVTEVIADHGLEVYISKAATVLDQVTDTFYVKDGDGGKLRDAALLSALQADLLAAAEGLADA